MNQLKVLLKKQSMVNQPKELVNNLNIKVILQAEHMYELLNADIQGIISEDGEQAIRAAENRADILETISKRNYYGFKACRYIQYLNTECKRVTGKAFLNKFYAVKGIKLEQINVSLFDEMLAEFDQLLAEAIEELEKEA